MSCNLDILRYWQSQSKSFPAVSCIAKDVLEVPIPSIAANSSISMGVRVLAKYRSSLQTDNIEAFVTIQDCLLGYLKEDEV
ncbi:Zinc finger BED domain-containing protein RICESLEEPER 4 [Bienertia sinuspersici]